MNRKQYILITAAFLFTIVCAVAYTTLYKSGRLAFKTQATALPSAGETEEIISANDENNTAEAEPAVTADIRVYVLGAVSTPDVYTFSEGDIVKDAIEAAGGATEEADLEAINLAEKIYDGQKLRIPKIGEAANEEAAAAQNPANMHYTDGRVNINTAPLELLITLDGIGESIGNGIITYREKYGRFKTIEDIKNVSRIGEKTFEKIKDSICVE